MGKSLIRLFRHVPAYQPTAVVLIAVLYLTLLPQPLGEEEIFLFEGADKVVHFIMFGGLTGTFIFDRFRTGRTLGLRGALLAALASASLGTLIEYLQYAMHMGRAGNDIYDAGANILGAFTAMPICVWFRWIKPGKGRRA